MATWHYGYEEHEIRYDRSMGEVDPYVHRRQGCRGVDRCVIQWMTQHHRILYQACRHQQAEPELTTNMSMTLEC